MGGADHVAPEERIATFDNDGTLWSEQPYYFQVAFALDRMKAIASQHPEWQEKEPFKSVLAGDLNPVLAGGLPALAEIVIATHSGMTIDEFEVLAREWLAASKESGQGQQNSQVLAPGPESAGGIEAAGAFVPSARS